MLPEDGCMQLVAWMDPVMSRHLLGPPSSTLHITWAQQPRPSN